MLNFVEIGRIIVVLRERKGLTQEKLALEAAGLSAAVRTRRFAPWTGWRPYWDWSSPHFCCSPKEGRNHGKNCGRSAMERHRHTPDRGGTV